MRGERRNDELRDQFVLDLTRSMKDRAEKTRDAEPAEAQQDLEQDQQVLDRQQAELDQDQAALEQSLTHLEDEQKLHRDQAALDREQAALDRDQAKLDRAQSALDRVSGARKDYLIDELTGILRRGPGLLELQHEIDRARRQGHPLIVAFIDVNGLKSVNDREGHAAGDQVLREVAEALRQGLRSYDLMFRYGGDEFICALSEADIEHAEQRLRGVADVLGRAPTHASMDWGLAELAVTDTLDDLVDRADSALYMARRSRGAPATE
ncbi:MAG: diguanylate cyclase [Actinomycetota bacterium]|nr:diguanylate cyclase [Actinomycetota bacterium]